MSIPITEKLIQRQINHWNRFREFLQDEEKIPAKKPVITVSRQAGAGGRALASALCDRFELELHDQSLVERIAKDSHLEASIVAELDENAISQIDLWVRGVLKQRIFMKDQYHVSLVKTVSTLAARGGVVFLGRGANLILGHTASLRIRVVADYNTRLRNIMTRTGLTKPEARALLDETDRKRSAFIRSVFRQESGQPRNFDLVLNSERLRQECMIEIASLAILARTTDGRALLADAAHT